MKLLILSPVAYSFWNYPTYSLIGIIALLFTIQVISELMRLNTLKNDSYEEIKQLFKQMDEFDYSEKKETASTTLKVVPVDFTFFSYRDLQAIAKSLNISGRNRKRLILEQELLALCK